MSKRLYTLDAISKSDKIKPAFDRMCYLTNIIANGDFANTTGWVGTACALTASDNALILTNNGSQAYGLVTYETAVLSANGKKVYLGIMARVTNAVCSYIMHIIDAKSAGTNQEILQASPVENKWYLTSVVKTQPADVNGVAVLKCINNYSNAGAASGKILQIKHPVMIDLASHYGAGNEPSAEQMALILSAVSNGFFSGSRMFRG